MKTKIILSENATLKVIKTMSSTADIIYLKQPDLSVKTRARERILNLEVITRQTTNIAPAEVIQMLKKLKFTYYQNFEKRKVRTINLKLLQIRERNVGEQ